MYHAAPTPDPSPEEEGNRRGTSDDVFRPSRVRTRHGASLQDNVINWQLNVFTLATKRAARKLLMGKWQFTNE